MTLSAPPIGTYLPAPSSYLRKCAAMVAALLLLQMPLWINPGYFSHDELQWATRAALPLEQIHFVSFNSWDSFQFRPLTFNLWLLLSHFLFETPRLFHALFVILGAGNALLLASVLRRAGTSANVTLAAALIFGLTPYSVWVQGWVGCLADLIWVGCALLIVRTLQALESRRRDMLWSGLAAALGTAIGLYAKEAALPIPALLGLGTWLLRFPRNWLIATLTSAALALMYLALRLDVLLHAQPDSSYSISLLAIPQRWLEYQIYPWAEGVTEIHVLTLKSAGSQMLRVLGLLGLAWCLWKASPRLWLAWLAGGILALAPVLPLASSANQYGYGFIALVCGIIALAWSGFSRYQRVFVALLIGLTLLHGFQIQKRLYIVGRLQAVFSDSLGNALQHQTDAGISLWPDHSAHWPVYARLTHDIPSWKGTPVGDRVHMADSAENASHRIARDGTVYAMEDDLHD